MLRNPIHKRLEKFVAWQHLTFMACLCERMYPNYQFFCRQSGFGDGMVYHRILDLVWQALLVKGAKINFDSQLEKLEDVIPDAAQFSAYAVYPAIDACIALGETLHAQLSGETCAHAITVSETSLRTIAMFEMTRSGHEMSEQQLKELPAIQDELDLQWQIFRLLVDCQERDLVLIRGLRSELREAATSNIGINLEQDSR